jgi:hypothetical protein
MLETGLLPGSIVWRQALRNVGFPVDTAKTGNAW